MMGKIWSRRNGEDERDMPGGQREKRGIIHHSQYCRIHQYPQSPSPSHPPQTIQRDLSSPMPPPLHFSSPPSHLLYLPHPLAPLYSTFSSTPPSQTSPNPSAISLPQHLPNSTPTPRHSSSQSSHPHSGVSVSFDVYGNSQTRSDRLHALFEHPRGLVREDGGV